MREGEKIKVFSDTDVEAYLRYFNHKGYKCQVEDGYIVVGGRKIWRYDSKKIGEVIYNKRNNLNMSRGEFAEIMEVTPYTVFTWEAGRFSPRDYYMKKIQEILDISEGELKECRI